MGAVRVRLDPAPAPAAQGVSFVQAVGTLVHRVPAGVAGSGTVYQTETPYGSILVHGDDLRGTVRRFVDVVQGLFPRRVADAPDVLLAEELAYDETTAEDWCRHAPGRCQRVVDAQTATEFGVIELARICSVRGGATPLAALFVERSVLRRAVGDVRRPGP